MFDIGWSELVIIGVVALIVIGPRDLPDMFRTLGRFTAKLRSMARDFQRAMESAADEAGVKDVAKDLKAMTSTRNLGLDAVKEAASKFEKWDPLKPASAKAATPPRSAAGVAAPPPVAAAAVAAPATAVAADASQTPVVNLGPSTQALAEKVAASRAAATETAATIRKTRAAKAKPEPASETPPGPDA